MLKLAEELGRVPSPQETFDLFCRPPQISVARKEAEQMALGEPFSFKQDRDRIQATSFGSGERLVVLVHGWGGRGAQMTGFLPNLLEQGFRVITFDGPAHGDSEGTICHAPRMADCLRILERREEGIFGIIGHSFGTIGINLAMNAGLDVQRVVEVAPFCWIKNRFREFCNAVGLSQEGEDEMLEISEQYFTPGYLDSMAADKIAYKFKAEGLLFHDREDREIPIAHAEAIAANWPGCHFITTEKLGHRRIIRDSTVLQTTARFLDSGPTAL